MGQEQLTKVFVGDVGPKAGSLLGTKVYLCLQILGEAVILCQHLSSSPWPSNPGLSFLLPSCCHSALTPAQQKGRAGSQGHQPPQGLRVSGQGPSRCSQNPWEACRRTVQASPLCVIQGGSISWALGGASLFHDDGNHGHCLLTRLLCTWQGAMVPKTTVGKWRGALPDWSWE